MTQTDNFPAPKQGFQWILSDELIVMCANLSQETLYTLAFMISAFVLVKLTGYFETERTHQFSHSGTGTKFSHWRACAQVASADSECAHWRSADLEKKPS